MHYIGKFRPAEHGYFQMNLSHTKHFGPPWIIAHRGHQAKYPENTLSAFRAAVDAGASMIELDVMLTRDRKMVVIHDPTLERTTNGQGLVSEHTLRQLKQLDAGSWFNPLFAGERLPELIEVLEAVGGRTFINIEIKACAYEAHHPEDAIENQVVNIVRQKKARDYVLLSSFDWNMLQHLHTIKGVPRLALISDRAADRSVLELCRRLEVFSWHPDRLVVTAEQVDLMHAAGIRVFPYNVEALEEFEQMMRLHVDGTISNDPEQIAAWLRHKKTAGRFSP